VGAGGAGNIGSYRQGNSSNLDNGGAAFNQDSVRIVLGKPNIKMGYSDEKKVSD
jgi:hypothetical protein